MISHPQKLFYYLQQDFPDAVLLESSGGPAPQARYTVMSAKALQTLDSNHVVSPLEHLQQTLQAHAPAHHESQLFFTGGWIGYLGYEFGQSLYPKHLRRQCSTWPDVYFALYDWSLVYDHHTHEYSFWGNHASWQKSFEHYDTLDDPTWMLPQITDFRAHSTPQEYQEKVLQIQKLILEGDVYQVNLAQKFEAHCANHAFDVYHQLTQTQPVPFAAYLPVYSNRHVISASPELFLQKQQQHVCTRPIKGTAARFDDLKQDQASQEYLISSEKEKAELLMIVDLERNDLSKVCESGSVQVPEFRVLETYSKVHHTVSTVSGVLKPQCSFVDLLEALFPCGSITGAPKIRAMQRIQDFEDFPRKVYTGSVGWIDFAENLQFNVAIRTLLKENHTLEFCLGGGITIHSDPEKEYLETLHKGEALMQALGGSLF